MLAWDLDLHGGDIKQGNQIKTEHSLRNYEGVEGIYTDADFSQESHLSSHMGCLSGELDTEEIVRH